MKIYLVTGNKHKVGEISALAGDDWTIVPITSVINNKIKIEEKGDSFLQNALIKVESFKHLKIPLMADDSGLEIDALGGFPGIKSARFMDGYPYTERMEELLTRLESEENRKARFKCAAVYYHPTGVMLAAEGVVEGTIAFEIRGARGFGYDPIFVPEGYNMTFGELGEEVKSTISHRATAFKKLFSLLRLFFSSTNTTGHHRS